MAQQRRLRDEEETLPRKVSIWDHSSHFLLQEETLPCLRLQDDILKKVKYKTNHPDYETHPADLDYKIIVVEQVFFFITTHFLLFIYFYLKVSYLIF